MSQIFDIVPFFYDKKQETFYNCFIDIHSLFHEMKNDTSINILRHFLIFFQLLIDGIFGSQLPN